MNGFEGGLHKEELTKPRPGRVSQMELSLTIILRVDEADGWRYPHVHRTLCLHIIGGNYSSQIKEKNFFFEPAAVQSHKKSLQICYLSPFNFND